MKLDDYKSIVFDCDGVLLDSNRIKTNAFYKTTIPFGVGPANCLVDYHKKNGGISRFVKFMYFADNILPAWNIFLKDKDETVLKLIKTFSDVVLNEYAQCKIVGHLNKLRLATKNAKWHVVSGGLEGEIIDILQAKNVSHLFDGGIFGSPDNKDQIFQREMSNGNIQRPCLFIGDSQYDYQSASNAKVDFIFASYWTEMPNYNAFAKNNQIEVISSLADLL